VLSSTWIAHHRLLTLGVGFAVLLVAVGFGVWLFVLRSPGTQVDLREAVRQFRASQGADLTGSDTTLPAAGVYQYRTTGGEQLSVGGISRGFPSVTPMIVTDSGCATMTWEPLVQHMEGLVICPTAGGALVIEALPSSEVIAGTRTTTDIRCPSGTYFVPPGATRGERWRATCHAGSEKVVLSGLVVCPSEVTVAGQRVPALHTTLSLAFSGSQKGSNPNQYWVSPQNGMILRQRETVDMAEGSGPFGPVHYSEDMTIALTALHPAR